MTITIEQVKKARQASRKIAVLGTAIRNRALEEMARQLITSEKEILSANEVDVEKAVEKGLSSALIARLTLDRDRIKAMSDGLLVIRDLPDPLGQIVKGWKTVHGLDIAQVRVPMGVVGIIYESRPNVTVDAVGLCIKSGNAVVLKGGSEAINSNRAIVRVLRSALDLAGVPAGAVGFIDSTERSAVHELFGMTGLIDVLVPRGGAELISTVVRESHVPVIETGVGNCHIYVDKAASKDMAVSIVNNAKTSNPAVCNAVETVLIHQDIARELIPRMVENLKGSGVEVRGCTRTREIEPVTPAGESDWKTEYLDLVVSVRVVDDINQALEHIAQYGTGHSETIITKDYQAARLFQQEVDAACVYVNASPRFTDGGQFGFGAELGISTQKLHARGPMGLNELTTTKYLISGQGQVR